MYSLTMIPLLPLLGFLINGLLGARLPRVLVSIIACGLPAASFVLTLNLFLRLVADGVNALRTSERSMLIITHYQRLLDYIEPDHVHVLAHGQIQRSGGKELALELEANGYAEFDGKV